ncbi:MAG: DUF3987 domain-containing protein, partial [Aeromonas sp.]
RVASWGQEFEVTGCDGDEVELARSRLKLIASDKYFSQKATESQLASAEIWAYLQGEERAQLSEVNLKNTLAAKHGLSVSQIESLWGALESDSDSAPDPHAVEACLTGIPASLTKSAICQDEPEQTLGFYLTNVRDPITDRGFVDELSRFCKVLGVPEMAVMVCLGPVIATLVRPSVRLIGMEASGLMGRPGNWAMLLGDSGAAKSPLCRALTSALFKIQSEFNRENFEPAYAEWLQKPPRARGPQPRMFTAITTDTTPEAIRICQAANGDAGLLLYLDELAKIFSLGQYKQGGGSSRQELLEARSGDPVSVRRVGKDASHDIMHNGLQILGGIKPLVYKRLFDREDPDGFTARFNVAYIPVQEGQWDDGPGIELPRVLHRVLAKMRAYPEWTHRFSATAQIEFRRWYEYCQKQKVTSPSRPLAAIYSKSVGEALNRSIELHYFLHALESQDGSMPPTLVDVGTLKKAIALVSYQQNIAREMAALSLADEATNQYAEAIRISRRAACDKSRTDRENPFCGWVSPGQVRQFLSASPETQSGLYQEAWSRQEIGNLFARMAKHGYGETRVRGQALEFRAYPRETDIGHAKAGAFEVGLPNVLVPDRGMHPSELLEIYEDFRASSGEARATACLTLTAAILDMPRQGLAIFCEKATNFEQYETELAAIAPEYLEPVRAAISCALAG